MSKEEDTKFLKIQTCVLKVNIHCDGCKLKVKKILHKVEGVYITTIDAEHGKVTVSGDVDPETLIKKLVKNGKHAELITPKSTSSSSSSINNNAKSQQQQQQISNKFHSLQLGSGKCGQKENPKPQKAQDVDTVGVANKSKGGQPSPTPPPPQPQQQQHKKHLQQVIKDAKPPTTKETPKAVKFDVPEDDGGGSEFNDDLDDYDDDFDGSFDDEFDEDFEEDPKQIKPSKPNNNTNVNTNRPVGAAANGSGKVGNIPNAKKGDHGGDNEDKRGCREGPNQAGLRKPNDFGGVVKDAKNVSNNAGGNRPGVMGPGVVAPMPVAIAQSVVNPNLPPAASVQGLPAGGSAYFHGAGAVGAPPQSGPNTAYHQQQQQRYLAAMMQQQQQQRMMMMMMMMNGQDRTFQPMVYARPPPLAVSYIPPPLPPEYSHFFSDENTTGGCAVM